MAAGTISVIPDRDGRQAAGDGRRMNYSQKCFDSWKHKKMVMFSSGGGGLLVCGKFDRAGAVVDQRAMCLVDIRLVHETP